MTRNVFMEEMTSYRVHVLGRVGLKYTLTHSEEAELVCVSFLYLHATNDLPITVMTKYFITYTFSFLFYYKSSISKCHVVNHVELNVDKSNFLI